MAYILALETSRDRVTRRPADSGTRMLSSSQKEAVHCAPQTASRRTVGIQTRKDDKHEKTSALPTRRNFPVRYHVSGLPAADCIGGGACRR